MHARDARAADSNLEPDRARLREQRSSSAFSCVTRHSRHDCSREALSRIFGILKNVELERDADGKMEGRARRWTIDRLSRR
jgi:hypothetical protein